MGTKTAGLLRRSRHCKLNSTPKWPKAALAWSSAWNVVERFSMLICTTPQARAHQPLPLRDQRTPASGADRTAHLHVDRPTCLAGRLRDAVSGNLLSRLRSGKGATCGLPGVRPPPTALSHALEKLNCAYCAYANGLVGYVGEIAARTEAYWCPIKHARRMVMTHARYADFADFGDAEAYRRAIAASASEDTAPTQTPTYL